MKTMCTEKKEQHAAQHRTGYADGRSWARSKHPIQIEEFLAIVGCENTTYRKAPWHMFNSNHELFPRKKKGSYYLLGFNEGVRSIWRTKGRIFTFTRVQRGMADGVRWAQNDCTSETRERFLSATEKLGREPNTERKWYWDKHACNLIYFMYLDKIENCKTNDSNESIDTMVEFRELWESACGQGAFPNDADEGLECLLNDNSYVEAFIAGALTVFYNSDRDGLETSKS